MKSGTDGNGTSLGKLAKAGVTSDGLNDHTIKMSNIPDVFEALALVNAIIKAKGDWHRVVAVVVVATVKAIWDWSTAESGV